MEKQVLQMEDITVLPYIYRWKKYLKDVAVIGTTAVN